MLVAKEREANVAIRCQRYHSIFPNVLWQNRLHSVRNRTYHRADRNAAISKGNRHTNVLEKDRHFDLKYSLSLSR